MIMDELTTNLIIYGYVLPLQIMLVWIMWCVYSDLKAGERFVSHFLRDCWPVLIPFVNLFCACLVLSLAMTEISYWLEKHWEPWREAGEQGRRIARWMFGEIKED